jgi:serine protease Do
MHKKVPAFRTEASPMQTSPNAHEAQNGPRRVRSGYVIASAVLGAGLLGTALLAPSSPTLAQLKSTDTVQTPFGRAPLTFADIVDRVKPAVVSVQVTSGAKVAQKGRSPRNSFPDLPEDHPFNEFFKNLPKEFRGNPQMPRPTQAQGSGFVISADGFVVTRGDRRRHRSAHRHRPAQDQGLQVLPVREVC